MAGHSKAKNIQHRKNRQDKVKCANNAYFSQIIYNIVKSKGLESIEAQEIISRAKSVSIPNDVIQKSIANATNANKIDGETIYYACYKHPIYVIIKTITDNRNKFSYIRSALSQQNYNIIAVDSCGYIFDHVSLLIIQNNNYNIDELFLEFGDYSENILEDNENNHVIITSKIENHQNISNILLHKNYSIIYFNIAYFANNLVNENESYNEIINNLCNNPEVKEIYSNVDFEPICSDNE